MFLEQAARNWWTLVVRGVLAIAFGVLTLLVPNVAVLSLVLVFGIYSIAEGVVALSMLRGPAARGAWLLGLAGVLSIIVGIIALVWPGITAAALFYLIAAWAVVIGLVELISAISYSSEIEDEWAFILSGLLWVGFGVILVVWPNIGIVTVLALIATAALLRGLMMIIAGFRLKNVYRRLRSGAGAA
jgi:uncharacterized membrane protein HdeD (DUF308 family)